MFPRGGAARKLEAGRQRGRWKNSSPAPASAEWGVMERGHRARQWIRDIAVSKQSRWLCSATAVFEIHYGNDLRRREGVCRNEILGKPGVCIPCPALAATSAVIVSHAGSLVVDRLLSGREQDRL